MGECNLYLIKAISILIEDEIYPDILLRIMASAKTSTPILYSLVNILKKAEFIDVPDKQLLYFISKHIIKLSKYIQSNTSSRELIHASIKDELESLSIWIDVDNNLSNLVLILYKMFPEDHDIESLVKKVNNILLKD